MPRAYVVIIVFSWGDFGYGGRCSGSGGVDERVGLTAVAVGSHMLRQRKLLQRAHFRKNPRLWGMAVSISWAGLLATQASPDGRQQHCCHSRPDQHLEQLMARHLFDYSLGKPNRHSHQTGGTDGYPRRCSRSHGQNADERWKKDSPVNDTSATVFRLMSDS
jgi:hypothetical protein